MKNIVKVLMTLAKFLDSQGFPKDPLIVQSDPSEEYCFFICLWKNVGDRKVETLEYSS